ncbi:hypothetical protein [Cupriavidus sp. BIC8F]|uniref:hypothetical protein n=1 Tax=Cupriavidus sp. BIC8F TaxID=3079014 RepID=UPI0029168F98|nr:hypothetical protein [Cupriavidus sp. BIC8F]
MRTPHEIAALLLLGDAQDIHDPSNWQLTGPSNKLMEFTGLHPEQSKRREQA